VHLARVEAAESWNYCSLMSDASIYKFCCLSISIIFIYNILIINLKFIKFNPIKNGLKILCILHLPLSNCDSACSMEHFDYHLVSIDIGDKPEFALMEHY
jgi:hypothetical protein